MVISSGVCGEGNDNRGDCSVDDDIMIVVEDIINGDSGVCGGGIDNVDDDIMVVVVVIW